jgi:hypothetical protein
LTYLQREVADIHSGVRTSSVNCSALTLQTFVDALELDPKALPDGWTFLCEQTT